MSPSSKILMVVMVIAATLLYSLVERRKIDALQTRAQSPILKNIPNFTALDIIKNESINPQTLIASGERGTFVHFWGTWCAPCEAELPEFVEFAQKFENMGVSFLLLAVNDEEDKVRRFINTRLNSLPSNLIIGLDEKGESLPLFGTIKVPETYLFDRDLVTLTKFVGPQNWKLTGFVERTRRLLNQDTP